MLITIHNLDCVEYMSKCPDNSFDLAICDPPYGIKEDGRARQHRDFKPNGKRRTKEYKNTGKIESIRTNTYKIGRWDNKYPDQIYFDELFRVCKKHIIFGSNYIQFNQKNKSTGRIFWDKVMPDNDFSDGELAWTNKHTGIRQFEYMWNGMMQGKSIKEGRTIMGSQLTKEQRIHPTQKPVLLYKWLLKNYAKEGDTIFDSHLGSGSIAIACYDLKFNLVSCEIDKDYYTAAYKRLENHKLQTTLF